MEEAKRAREYKKPIVRVVRFESEDVILASNSVQGCGSDTSAKGQQGCDASYGCFGYGSSCSLDGAMFCYN